MQFVIIARDGEDEGALARRMAARDSHIAYGRIAAQTGEQLMAAAMLNSNGDMNGSVMIVEFENIEAVQAWLDKEAYITGDVWKDVQIIPCKVAPTFQNLTKAENS